MDKRQLAPVFALSRLVSLIDSSPSFLEVAKQSAAYEDLKSHVTEVQDFVEYFHQNVARVPILRGEIRATRRNLALLANSVVAVAALGRFRAKPWLEKMFMPAKNLSDSRFAYEVRSLAGLAQEHAEELTALGMLPGRPAHLKETAERLLKLHADLDLIELMLDAAKVGYPHLVDRARRTARALFLQVRPFITEEMRAEWQRASHLGRERGPALPRGSRRLALPNPEAAPGSGDTDVISLNAGPSPGFLSESGTA